MIQNQRAAAQRTDFVPIGANLLELFLQAAVRLIPENKPQHSEK
jgi:hypothetical protein